MTPSDAAVRTPQPAFCRCVRTSAEGLPLAAVLLALPGQGLDGHRGKAHSMHVTLYDSASKCLPCAEAAGTVAAPPACT